MTTVTNTLKRQYTAPLVVRAASTRNSTLGFRTRLVRNCTRVARDSIGATVDGVIGTTAIPFAAAGLADPKLVTKRLEHVAEVGDSNSQKIIAIWKGNSYKTPTSKTLRSKAQLRFTKKKMSKKDHAIKGLATLTATTVDGVAALPALVIGQSISALGKGNAVRDYGYRALVNTCHIPLDLHEMAQDLTS